jgi:LysM repeat protein
MRIHKFLSLALICLLHLTSFADVKKEKTLHYFNSFKKIEGLKISHAPGIYNQNIEVTIQIPGVSDYSVVTSNAKGDVRRGKSFTISETCVLRISYDDTTGVKRNYIGNYIVNENHDLPIVSLAVDAHDFFPPTGIYEGHMALVDSVNTRIGRAWEKQPITGFAQFFFNGKMVDELELDIKTYGGMTLGWKEKSIQLSARKELHGKSKIKVKLFENLPFREFQHVVLRTSGNDQNKTRIKDLSISQVAEEIHVNTKGGRQVVLYINGQYWGIHNLREKVNGDYFKYRYDWKKGGFSEIQGSGFGYPIYKKLINYVRKHSGDNDFKQRISDSIDIENFYNFNIIQTFISNVDYRGNIRFFRPNGGKWKWVLYDTDLGCNKQFLKRNFIRDRTFPVHEYWYNPSYAYTLLNNMLKNEDLKKRFINQYCFLMATHVAAENFNSKLDQNTAKIDSELDKHFKRRGRLYSENRNRREKEIAYLKTYFDLRSESAFKHLSETFSLGSPVPLKITQSNDHFNGIKVNGSEILVNNVDGKFYTEYDLTIEAVESNHLYKFDKWSDGNNKMARNILPGKVSNLNALFSHLDTSQFTGKLLLDNYYVNNSKKKPLIFTVLTNVTNAEIRLDNVILYEDISGEQMEFKNKVIGPGASFILTNQCELLKQKCKTEGHKVFNFMNGITFHNTIKLALIEKDKGWIDSLQLTVSDSLIIEHAGYLATKENGMVNIEPKKLKDLETLGFGREIVIEPFKEDPINSDSILATVSFIAIGALTAILGFLWFRRRKANLGIIILLLSSGVTFSQDSLESKEDKTLTRLDEITIRKDKFGLEAIENRATDNKGKGDERFNGTRNFRVVLYDLVYRGGGNNLHLKDTIPKYYLWNPMPLYGLKQLQKIGFDKAVYLYSHNFDYWYPQTRLDSLAESGFDYLCEMKIEGDYKEEYFADVMARANDTTMGMMYMHCWNGWHQSGTIAAYTLMQFCDYSNSQALKYWERCTDGNYKGFKTVKSRIRSFRPIKGYSFTDKQKKMHCPCEDDIKSSSGSQSADDKINLTEDEMMQKNHSSSNKSYSNYKVKPGDNLGEIAERHGMRLSELKKLNHIRGTTIYAGQSLKVYDRKSYSKKKSGFTYSVKNGDTLSDIAVKYKTTVAKIKKANNLKSDNLQIGDKLKIPQ